jgi:hypothetical protein
MALRIRKPMPWMLRTGSDESERDLFCLFFTPVSGDALRSRVLMSFCKTADQEKHPEDTGGGTGIAQAISVLSLVA